MFFYVATSSKVRNFVRHLKVLKFLSGSPVILLKFSCDFLKENCNFHFKTQQSYVREQGEYTEHPSSGKSAQIRNQILQSPIRLGRLCSVDLVYRDIKVSGFFRKTKSFEFLKFPSTMATQTSSFQWLLGLENDGRHSLILPWSWRNMVMIMPW